MDTRIAEVTLHIDEETSHDTREKFRDVLLERDGVIAAAGQDERPHLMLIEYKPDVIDSTEFVNAAKEHGLHAELIGF
ncbi:MAG: ATP-binding protein [Gammaproteobacteria bacterium]